MNITVTKGDSAVMELELTDSEGETYDYSNDVVKFGIKRSPQDQALVLEKTVEDGKITITPEDYSGMDGYGDFIYAIRVYHENESEETEVYTPIVARFSLGFDVIKD